MSEAASQHRLSSSGSNLPPSHASSNRRHQHIKVPKNRVSPSQSGSHSALRGRSEMSGADTEYSIYSLYSLYTLYSEFSYDDEVPLSTERSSATNNTPGTGRQNAGRPPRRGRSIESETMNTMTTTDREQERAARKTERDAEFERVEKEAREALEAIAMKDDDVMVRLPEYLETLRLYRRECSRRSMYKEAHLVHQVLRNLRLEEEARHIRGLTDHQMTERARMEDVHREEFRAFHAKWNQRIDHFEEAQLEEEIRVLEQQNDELLAFHEEMRDYNPRVVRFSKGLVHSRLKQHTLARQRNYARALEVKDEADEIEAGDIERFENTKNTMYARRERALRRRHQQALLALRNKVESRRNFLERARKRELDEMLQRYINARRELETHQNIIRSKTGTILLKHACNTKTDTSGSAAIIMSAESGAFGPTIRQQTVEYQQRHENRRIKDYDDDDEEFHQYYEDEEDYYCHEAEQGTPGPDGRANVDEDEPYEAYEEEEEGDEEEVDAAVGDHRWENDGVDEDGRISR